MKVPTLLEVIQSLNNELTGITNGSKFLSKSGKLPEKLARITAFYSQGFSPEMLTGEGAIFAGWDYYGDNPNTGGFWETENGWSVSREAGNWEMWVYESATHQNLNPEPQTLSQFISDCDRAGIPLKFSPLGMKMWEGK